VILVPPRQRVVVDLGDRLPFEFFDAQYWPLLNVGELPSEHGSGGVAVVGARLVAGERAARAAILQVGQILHLGDARRCGGSDIEGELSNST